MIERALRGHCMVLFINEYAFISWDILLITKMKCYSFFLSKPSRSVTMSVIICPVLHNNCCERRDI